MAIYSLPDTNIEAHEYLWHHDHSRTQPSLNPCINLFCKEKIRNRWIRSHLLQSFPMITVPIDNQRPE